MNSCISPRVVVLLCFLFLCDETRSSRHQNHPHYHHQQQQHQQLHGDYDCFSHEQQQQQQQYHRQQQQQQPLRGPAAPLDHLPVRFLRAAKGDVAQGWKRYQDTLQWREQNKVDNILRQAIPEFDDIAQHYQQYFHGRSRTNQPVFYERPGYSNLAALQAVAPSMTLPRLVWYYTFLTEFLWQVICPDDTSTSLYILDLQGIAWADFVGDTRRLVGQAAALSAAHYPERAGTILVLNAPRWFAMLWRTMQPILDPATLEKIQIVGTDKNEKKRQAIIQQTLLHYIAPDQLPPEYGGRGLPLGRAPEHTWLRQLVEHNNRLLAEQRAICANCEAHYHRYTTTTTTTTSKIVSHNNNSNKTLIDDQMDESWPCAICQWRPVRSY